jgi:hypothetical protein
LLALAVAEVLLLSPLLELLDLLPLELEECPWSSSVLAFVAAFAFLDEPDERLVDVWDP